jgi:hypothetical protein|tara:strand:+ start:12082 stop:12483 length:402 start_codon:yes stop_codon:yes gene_type:complete
MLGHDIGSNAFHHGRPHMSSKPGYLFTASMDIGADKEALFNEVYDNDHVPLLLEVPGVLSVARFKTAELTMILGGERRTIEVEGQPRYTAQYELESADVLLSDDWAEAVDAGRWTDEVRPFTTNRRHVLYERL